MICEIVHEGRAATDKRYRIDALAGADDPRDVDLLASMARAMMRMPTYPEGTEFRMDAEAYELMMQQVQIDPNALLRTTEANPFKFRSIPVNRVETST